jgi:hypothetical protein
VNSSRFKEFLVLFGFIAVVAAFAAIPDVYSSWKRDQITCETSIITHKVEYVESDDYDLGTETVTTEGRDGEQEVCRDGYNDLVSDETTTEPITKVVTKGTYVEPEPEYEYEESEYYVEPTATCRDGTYSYSQSRSGTCSWHGGVLYWH